MDRFSDMQDFLYQWQWKIQFCIESSRHVPTWFLSFTMITISWCGSNKNLDITFCVQKCKFGFSLKPLLREIDLDSYLVGSSKITIGLLPIRAMHTLANNTVWFWNLNLVLRAFVFGLHSQREKVMKKIWANISHTTKIKIYTYCFFFG